MAHRLLVGCSRGEIHYPNLENDFNAISRITAMNMKARVTKITDVARAAGTSPATVSRVLNGTGGVSPELKARVLKAAASLGYVPDGSARALRRQHASVWAAIVSDIENPFFTAVVRGIEDVARQARHRLVLCTPMRISSAKRTTSTSRLRNAWPASSSRSPRVRNRASSR
jgi:DNA-binding MurR/RpiR family transcriptional regulator